MYLRPSASVDLYRLPHTVTEKSISNVRVRPNNKMAQVETFHRSPEELHCYKSRLISGHNIMAVASVTEDKSIYLTRVADAYEFKAALKKAIKSPASSGPPKQTQVEDASSDDEKVQAITMRFSTVYEDEKRKRREASYAYMVERAEQEEWKDYKFIPRDTERGQDVRNQMATL